jgi:hypothetical protein
MRSGLSRFYTKALAKVGLMRVRDQVVKELKISNDEQGRNYLVVEFNNGFRWSGYHARESMTKVDTRPNPAYWT